MKLSLEFNHPPPPKRRANPDYVAAQLADNEPKCSLLNSEKGLAFADAGHRFTVVSWDHVHNAPYGESFNDHVECALINTATDERITPYMVPVTEIGSMITLFSAREFVKLQEILTQYNKV